jgi:predicted dithiol-disulfide oxidoreductase (DUF899 family)
MGWKFPWVSSYGSEYSYDFGFAVTDEQMATDDFRSHAPDGALLAPYYYQLLDQVPKGRGDEVRARRHDEYEDAGHAPLAT